MNPEEVKAIRTRLGLTQQRLAEVLNVTQSTVARWEAGTLTVTTRNAMAIDAFAEAMGQPTPGGVNRLEQITEKLFREVECDGRIQTSPLFAVNNEGMIEAREVARALLRGSRTLLDTAKCEFQRACARDEITPTIAVQFMETAARTLYNVISVHVSKLDLADGDNWQRQLQGLADRHVNSLRTSVCTYAVDPIPAFPGEDESGDEGKEAAVAAS
jgi:transcriptional regulator with XRE-family HTH domain